SNPVWLPEVIGIDPSLFFDEDGKAYITYNSGPPDDKPFYEGHRTIRIIEFDYKNLKTIGRPKILVNGGVDISKKPIWIEGPHIYKIDGWYYLSCAEGGTAEDHRQVVFRSKNVFGPYEAYKTPILTQRHLSPSRKFPVTCTGHADFVQVKEGEWWAVFLGCSPYEPFYENYYNTGRETFLAKIRWKDGWPIITEGGEEVKYFEELPLKRRIPSGDIPYSGNFTIRFDFSEGKLHPSFFFLRTPSEKWYEFVKDGLAIKLRRDSCAQYGNPSFIGRRLQHSKGYVMTKMLFNPYGENEKAGLIIFQDEEHFYYLCKSKKNDKYVIELYVSDGSKHPDYMKAMFCQELSNNEPLVLKIEFKGRYFNFYYGFSEKDLKILAENVDATFLSIRKAWGFTGNVLAMYALSMGKTSTNSVLYYWFEYGGRDDIYEKGEDF
ncbi:MAG: family 43 glycosylhydrolase, partial [Brevinematia bacterium]